MMKKTLWRLFTLAIVVALISPLIARNCVGITSVLATNLIYVTPGVTIAQQDDLFNFSISITDSDYFRNYTIEVTYPSGQLEIVRNDTEPDPSAPTAYLVYQGNVLSKSPTTSTIFTPTVNNGVGWLQVNETIVTPLNQQQRGPGWLFNATFKVKAPGICSLRISSSHLFTRLAGELPHTTQDGVFTTLPNVISQEIPWENYTFVLLIDTNTTMSSVSFDQPNKALYFTASGTDGTLGYTTLVIPRVMLDAVHTAWQATFDGNSTLALTGGNATHAYVHVAYTLSTHNIRIIGDTVIPEYWVTNQIITWDNWTFTVQIVSNTSVSPLEFSQPNKNLAFNTTGRNGTVANTTLIIPKQMLDVDNDSWLVMMDGGINSTITGTSNSTHSFVPIIYAQSTHQITLIGKYVIPEFTNNTSLLILILTATILAAAMGKKFSRKRQTTSTVFSQV
ncbi:MAG TPA: hypothetical protein VMT01_02870 [Candidatus Acidoferrum sp.]|jgi:hypothetical protein|nr:hypothetical protein [Candidatus Acidoferrum sp.]